MARIIKAYKEQMQAAVLAGKLYHAGDRDGNGSFSQRWEEWFQNGWFELVEAAGQPYNGGDYVGAMRMNGGVFEYWIGILMRSCGELPASFMSVEIPAGEFGVAWIKGHDDIQLYSMHDACMEEFARNGFKPAADAWYIERYACPRFTQMDENGEVILDYMVSLKG